MRAERCDAVVLNIASTAATASGRSARGPLGCQSSASGAVNVRYTQKHGSVPSSVPSTSASTNRGSDARLIVARASARGAAAARGRVKRRIGHLSVVERGLRRSAAARAWVLIAATRRGDGVASALACGHALLGSGGGSIDDSVGADLLRKRCGLVARGAPDGWVRRRAASAAASTSRLAGSQRQRERVFQSGAFALVLRHDRLAQRAVRACSAVARDQIKRCPSRVCQYYRVPPAEVCKKNTILPVPYLWYLKGTLWRYRS